MTFSLSTQRRSVTGMQMSYAHCFASQERHLQFISVNSSALPEVRFSVAPVCLESNQYEVSNIDVCIVIVLLRWCLQWR